MRSDDQTAKLQVTAARKHVRRRASRVESRTPSPFTATAIARVPTATPAAHQGESQSLGAAAKLPSKSPAAIRASNKRSPQMAIRSLPLREPTSNSKLAAAAQSRLSAKAQSPIQGAIKPIVE